MARTLEASAPKSTAISVTSEMPPGTAQIRHVQKIGIADEVQQPAQEQVHRQQGQGDHGHRAPERPQLPQVLPGGGTADEHACDDLGDVLGNRGDAAGVGHRGHQRGGQYGAISIPAGT